MEIKVVRRYETRNKTAATELSSSKSRVDWRRTKRELILLDSNDESSGTSEEEEPSTSEDEVDDKDETAVKNSLSGHKEKSHNGEVTDSSEDEECIVPGKRKRLNSSVLYDSDESEDSDILVRKVFAKRHCIIDEDENSRELQPDKNCSTENGSTNKKVFAKLKQLARQRTTWRSGRSENCEDSSSEAEMEEEPFSHLPLTPTEGSETDCNSLKDFIVEEEEDDDDDDTKHVMGENEPQHKELNGSNSLLANYVPNLSRCDHYVHFKRIVKAFLINAIDDTFLSSLYDGTRHKKYAQDMLLSLHYLDDRFIQPRLENLVSGSRWKDRYKVLEVGMVCADRTRVYHNLKHFKYKLYLHCSSITELDGFEDEPVKDTVERLSSQLEDSGWIQKRYSDLEDCMNAADNFQEERID
ncbi:coiled-coil domain-containing protein 82 isoform X2 [Pezoporus flaviventris]|uniref:coiled-coil domain-containing protein 82 isoform X2 n=1 Tax=Pezoporus flaviventris TaxID=889875 RepID=UPI002AB0FC84|nr:coiled-coil domain-containing protein 82 isoform X2 [Pezoporus flaviventris]